MSRTLIFVLVSLLSTAAASPLWAGEPLWIDVRTAAEYNAGHVPNASHIPYENIVERITEVSSDKDELIYLYCRSGRRSGIAQASLQQAGYTRVVNAGGLEDARKKAAELTAD